jgi:hypothetical protein
MYSDVQQNDAMWALGFSMCGVINTSKDDFKSCVPVATWSQHAPMAGLIPLPGPIECRPFSRLMSGIHGGGTWREHVMLLFDHFVSSKTYMTLLFVYAMYHLHEFQTLVERKGDILLEQAEV